MLPRVPIRQTLPCFRPCRRPSSSDAASLYSSKVRGRWTPLSLSLVDSNFGWILSALPFAISAAEAVSYLGAAASLLNLTSFPMIFSSLAAHYVPNAGFTSYQPSRIQPLYLPGWFIDAEVTAKLWVGESGPHEVVLLCPWRGIDSDFDECSGSFRFPTFVSECSPHSLSTDVKLIRYVPGTAQSLLL